VPTDRGSPKQRIEQECSRRGPAAVADGCIALLTGDDADDDLLWVLGGAATQQVIDGAEGGRNGYWPRVWAARGLLHNWDDRATAAVIAAFDDEAWRVREMAAKVVAAHRIDAALESLPKLLHDPIPRVRAAAARARMRLTG